MGRFHHIIRIILGPAALRVGRERFFILGVTLFALKFMFDRAVARLAFGRDWSLINYLIPNEAYTLLTLPSGEQFFFLVMVAVAMPFVVFGILLTLARLHDARMPSAAAALFFVPGVNLLLFAVLSVLGPEKEPESPAPIASDAEVAPTFVLQYGRDDIRGARKAWGLLLPGAAGPSAVVSALYTAPLAIGVTLLGVSVFRDYGWGLFVGMPFAIGMIAALLHGYHVPRTIAQCVGVGCLSLLFSGMGMIAFAVEGAACLAMLLPLAAPIAILGALVGYGIQNRPQRAVGIPNALWTVLLAMPLLLGAEAMISRKPSLFEVTTSVEVNAPPAMVWQHVIAFSRIDPPTEWMFRAGVAYPVRARIVGSGEGAIRYCEFSTGPFVEPIVIWDAPRLLRFSVTDNPPPMRELSPFNIHPPHLNNFLVSRQGQFQLIELPGGRTLLRGTTWYEHRMWPETYWRWWSDAIIHRIHLRVLEHVKWESERAVDRSVGYHAPPT